MAEQSGLEKLAEALEDAQQAGWHPMRIVRDLAQSVDEPTWNAVWWMANSRTDEIGADIMFTDLKRRFPVEVDVLKAAGHYRPRQE